jgi:hypothetical protein
MNGPNNLIQQTIPSIGIINRPSFRYGVLNNVLTFSYAQATTGRLGIFAAQKNGVERAVILLLPLHATPDRVIICVTQRFAQAARDLNPLGWSNPLSKPFLEFVLLKHVVNRWGAQILASGRDMAFLYIVRAQGQELGPFSSDGPFVADVLNQIATLTGGAFSYDHVEAFTFSNGVSDFNGFIHAIAQALNVEAVYGIDPAGAVSVERPSGAIRKQFLSGQTGGPSGGFEFVGLDSWRNEDQFPRRTTFANPWPFNYLHNLCMPMYILNLALRP